MFKKFLDLTTKSNDFKIKVMEDLIITRATLVVHWWLSYDEVTHMISIACVHNYCWSISNINYNLCTFIIYF